MVTFPHVSRLGTLDIQYPNPVNPLLTLYVLLLLHNKSSWSCCGGVIYDEHNHVDDST